MPRPQPGRRTDSLFDNRFRYDYIYPRGRSGETLRAYDTLDNDRPVVIKRPAPQDAPPMRAGQEVSILNEKRALERLAGHPVLTELRHSGNFRVGGQVHQYIAIDLAEGKTVEDHVLELSAKGERMPELETFVVIDLLLDLLQAAHERKIVYNDVDAKHLFWDRDNYRLKVIDWGNAVFLDGEQTTVTRAADTFQVAELVHFVFSGGKRLERRSGDSAPNLADNLSPRLRSILAKAAAADPNARYHDITTLRRDLADMRRPVERTRDALLERVRNRLPNAASQEQFAELDALLGDAVQQDPGHPAARALAAEVAARLRQLAIQGDLDGARIYIENGNYARALDLLNEIKARVGSLEDQPLLAYLIDAAAQLREARLSKPPAGLSPALDALYRGDASTAARALVITPEGRIEAKEQQLLLAERLALLMPGVVLLRPHLARVEQKLANRASERAILTRLVTALDTPTEPGVQPLRRLYANLAETLGGFEERLESDARDACTRAAAAANDIADLLEIVAANALGDSNRAGNALRQASAIDPTHEGFERVAADLNAFHQEVDRLTENAPGQDVAGWLDAGRTRLAAFQVDITDPALADLVARMNGAVGAMEAANASFASGGKRPAVEAYEGAAALLGPVNKAAAGWFTDRARQVSDARFIEALHPNSMLGKALSEGWDAWDKGRNGDALGIGQRALEAAHSEGEREAAIRLIRMADLTQKWLTGNGMGDRTLTEATERDISALLTPAEEAVERKFTDQMPNRTVYLKAMNRGLVEPMRDMSSAAVRILMMQLTMQGLVALLNEQPDDANMWRDAASRTLPNVRAHPIYVALEHAITRRQLLANAATALNTVRGVADLQTARPALRQPLAAAWLEPAEGAVRNIDDALRKWTDGDFRGAHALLDTAFEKIKQAEGTIGAPLDGFKNWLSGLNTTSEALQQARRTIDQAALNPTDAPDPAIDDAHWQIFSGTRAALGEDYAALVRQWRDTYSSIKDLYADERFTRDEKLRLLDGHFNSLFIEKHPAFPIYRHWQSLVRALPDPAPTFSYAPAAPPPERTATDALPGFVEENVRPSRVIDSYMSEAAPPSVIEPATVDDAPYDDGTRNDERVTIPRVPWLAGLAVVVVVGVAVIAAITLLGGNRGATPGIALTLPPTPTVAEAATAAIITTDAPTSIPAVALVPLTEPATSSATPSNTPTTAPSSTPTDAPTELPTTPTTPTVRFVPTETRPFATAAPFETAVPTIAPTGVATTSAPTTAPTLAPTNAAATVGLAPLAGATGIATATLPANVASGEYDLLGGLGKLPGDTLPWPLDFFTPDPDAGGWKLGTANTKGGNVPQYAKILPSTLGSLFGPDASRTVMRAEAVLELTSFNASLANAGIVYFGFGFETLSGQQKAYAQVNVARVSPLTANYGTNINGTLTRKATKAAQPIRVTLAVQRNDDRTVSLYADGQLLGKTTAAQYGPATSVNIVLYTSAPTVLVNVASLKVQIG